MHEDQTPASDDDDDDRGVRAPAPVDVPAALVVIVGDGRPDEECHGVVGWNGHGQRDGVRH